MSYTLAPPRGVGLNKSAPDLPHRLRLLLWHGHVIWVGQGLAIRPHRHVAHQMSISLDTEFAHEDEHGKLVWGHGFVVTTGVPHGFHSKGSAQQMICWAEPHTWAGRQVAARFASGITVVSEDVVGAIRDALQDIDLMSCDRHGARRARDVVHEALLGKQPPGPAPDPRVARAAEFMFRNRHDDTPVREVANHVGLSEAHFSRLFRREMGAPPSRYRLWMRALEAARLVLEGQSVTEAAHGAGFADAAHFTRTYNALIGSGGPHANIAGMEVVVCDDRWREQR